MSEEKEKSQDDDPVAQAQRQRKSLYIAMEMAEEGDMHGLINEQKQKRKYFSELEIW